MQSKSFIKKIQKKIISVDGTRENNSKVVTKIATFLLNWT